MSLNGICFVYLKGELKLVSSSLHGLKHPVLPVYYVAGQVRSPFDLRFPVIILLFPITDHAMRDCYTSKGKTLQIRLYLV